MNKVDAEQVRDAVRDSYAKVARQQGGGCCSGSDCCAPTPVAISGKALGYSDAELQQAPEGANLGLGCGNPQAIASLRPGETVLDLGSGAGFDAFLAARAVGAEGRVLGIDMTPDMVAKARANAAKGGHQNVEFRQGLIEQLPLTDDSVDVIISNCVINLSPEKPQVFAEALRVLKPGGRLAISDVVATAELPPQARADLALYTGCMAGASTIGELERMLRAAGFADIAVEPQEASREFIRDWAPGRNIEAYVVSAHIRATKPCTTRNTA